jgi:hypothetical protein
MTLVRKPVGKQPLKKWRKRCKDKGLRKYIMRLQIALNWLRIFYVMFGTKLVAYIFGELVIRSNLGTKVLNSIQFKANIHTEKQKYTDIKGTWYIHDDYGLPI